MKLVNVIQWGNIYFVGACENHTFEAELEGQTDLGRGIVNAPKTMIAGFTGQREEVLGHPKH